MVSGRIGRNYKMNFKEAVIKFHMKEKCVKVEQQRAIKPLWNIVSLHKT